MSESLNQKIVPGEAKKPVHVASVVRHGERLTLPEQMTIDDAIDLLQRRKKFETEEVVIQETFDVFPYDGAVALDAVMNDRYGWVPAIATPGFFGDDPPKLITIEVAYGEFKQVPWGRFSLPNVKGYIQTGAAQKNGRYLFAIGAKVLRQEEDTIKQLFDELRAKILKYSIYRGKAVKIRFRDKDGDPLPVPEPKFLDTESIEEGMLVFSDSLQRSINTNLFTPITRARDLIANNIPIKRGVLLGGVFGTGKTLAAAVASKLAVRAGITYVYVPRADELADAIEFAKMYQSPACVVFCEDIDRAMEGERTVEMDTVLNIIDGIDSKQNNIIVVLTTNHLEEINPAMLRPGRLDAVLEVIPPDARAVERLVRLYGGAAISEHEDLFKVGEELAGKIPAVIAEAVKRAKLSQLSLQPPGQKVAMLSAEALLDAAFTMKRQIDLLTPHAEQETPALEEALGGVVHRAMDGEFKTVANKVARIDKALRR